MARSNHAEDALKVVVYNTLNTKLAREIRNKHSAVLVRLSEIQSDLRRSFADMDDPIDALGVSVLSGEPLLFIGKPGTAKSLLIRLFCEHIGIQMSKTEGSHPDYFEYLMTPFTEPNELFGYFDVAKAVTSKQLVRDDKNMMQKAKVVYLDEVFNGSSAVLNSLLAFMNERIFHDRGVVQKVALESLFAATNSVPETAELRAVFDRFLLRCEMSNIQPAPDNVTKLLQTGWNTTYGARGTGGDPTFLINMKAFREDMKTSKLMTFEDERYAKALSKLIGVSRTRGLSEVSNRRLIKFQFVLATHAVFRSARDKVDPQITSEDLKLWKFILDRRDRAFEEMMSHEI